MDLSDAEGEDASLLPRSAEDVAVVELPPEALRSVVQQLLFMGGDLV